MPTYDNILRFQDALDGVALRFGDSWIPRWPRDYDIPQPLPQEAVSSWILRYASSRQQTTRGILRGLRAQNGRSLFSRDFDADALPWEFVGSLACTDITSLRKLVPAWSHALSFPDLVCLQADPMRMTPQVRYCRECLASDPTPYFRQSWRLSSAWICPAHRTAMRDQCPHCCTPLGRSLYLKRRMNVANLRICRSCGGDLCLAPDMTDVPVWLSLEIIAIQEHFEYLLNACTPPCQGADHPVITVGHNSAPSNEDAPTAAPPAFAGELAIPPKTISDDARVKLAEAMRSIELTGEGENKEKRKIAVGIEAHHLFGRKTGLICSHLMNCQNLFGTTVWSAGERFFKDALQRTWHRRDFMNAYKWIQTYDAEEAGVNQP